MADIVRVDGIGYKRRNPWGALLLGLVTLGIYLVVWYYKLNNELNNYGLRRDPTVATLAVTLGGLLIVPPFVSYYRTSDAIRQAQERSGASERIAPGLVLVLLFLGAISGVGIFVVPYMQSQVNKAWDALAAAGAPVEPA